jgi:hypothetical protein
MPDTNAATAAIPVAEQTPTLPDYMIGNVLVFLHETGKNSPVVLKKIEGGCITFEKFQDGRFTELYWPAEHLVNSTRPMTSAENVAFIAKVAQLQAECEAFIVALREGGMP